MKRKAINFNHVDMFLGTGVDPVNRIIHLSEALDRDEDDHSDSIESSARIIRAFLFLDRHSSEPITFYIDTPGGSEFKMFAIYDTMMICRSTIITVAVGAVQSAGGLLLAAGDKRYACENSYFMAHHGQSTMRGDYSSGELRAYTGLLLQMEHQWANLMQRHTNRSSDWWTEELNRRSEVWLTPKEMLEYGIVDGIFCLEAVRARKGRNVRNARAKAPSVGATIGTK